MTAAEETSEPVPDAGHDLSFTKLLKLFNGPVDSTTAIPHPDQEVERMSEGLTLREAAVLIPVMPPTTEGGKSTDSRPDDEGGVHKGRNENGSRNERSGLEKGKEGERQERRGIKESRVILTVRAEWLKRHAGQVSLPGGARDGGDDDIAATALREAEEEIGLAPERVKVIGKLGRLATPSGFSITPVVGVVEDGAPLVPCPREVSDIFTAPLELILDVSAYQVSSLRHDGRERRFLELRFGEYRIWGATAAILHHLARQVAARPGM